MQDGKVHHTGVLKDVFTQGSSRAFFFGKSVRLLLYL
jgi:hypothetical protein